jgi:GT2 family glycosyltransferase
MLLRCAAGLMLQEHDNFTIVVVDNGSTDSSIASLRDKYPEIRVIETGRNLGFAAGNNVAFRALSEQVDWFALLNPDAYPLPGWLISLDEATQTHRGYDLFASKCYCDNERRKLDGVGDEYHISGLVWRDANGCRDSVLYDSEKEVFSPCACAAMYSRKAVMDSGGFDEDFFCYIEDVDLGFRLKMMGYRCMYIPSAIVIHEGSGISGVHSDFQIYHGHRNLVWIFFKNMPLVLLLIFLPIHILMNICGILKYSFKGRMTVILRAKCDAIKGLGRMLGKRREVQSSRTLQLLSLLKAFSWKIGSI